jgi:hypothetical protein
MTVRDLSAPLESWNVDFSHQLPSLQGRPCLQGRASVNCSRLSYVTIERSPASLCRGRPPPVQTAGDLCEHLAGMPPEAGLVKADQLEAAASPAT